MLNAIETKTKTNRKSREIKVKEEIKIENLPVIYNFEDKPKSPKEENKIKVIYTTKFMNVFEI